ncbi:hypothetical protein QYM36_019396 [Artemia franciscana]|uniref:Uncharacterized protein n=1 Tax=Artemia franciscana TaxID=6661 RepID=A0AA88H1A4_ARTSF|nr:hypothetical protein QYM36_019396 [Artemia franciscana]
MYRNHPSIRNATKNYMKKEAREKGNGVESEDCSTDSNSSDKGGSNPVPKLANALAGTLSPPSTSVPTHLVLSSSLLLPYLAKVAQQPKLECIQKVTAEQQEACNKAWAYAFYACNIPFAVVKNEYFAEGIVSFLPVSKANERKIHKYLENRKIFAYAPALAAATLLAQLFGANPLTQDEFRDADGDPFNKRSEPDFVGVLNTELCSYIDKSGPFFKSLYFENAKAVESAAFQLAGFFVKLVIMGVFIKISTKCATVASCNKLWKSSERLEGMFMLPSCLSINSSLLRDNGDGLVEDDVPDISFEDALDEEEEQQL